MIMGTVLTKVPTNFSKLFILSAFMALPLAFADANGGYIQGIVQLPESVKTWDKVIVAICAKADPTCAKPAAVVKPKPAFQGSRVAPYTSPKLVAGQYTVYALNDKNGDLVHDVTTEELGGYFQANTFTPILVEPTKLGVNIDMIGFAN